MMRSGVPDGSERSSGFKVDPVSASNSFSTLWRRAFSRHDRLRTSGFRTPVQCYDAADISHAVVLRTECSFLMFSRLVDRSYTPSNAKSGLDELMSDLTGIDHKTIVLAHRHHEKKAVL